MTFVTIFESWGHNSLRWLRSINFDLVGRWDMTWFFSPFFEAKSCYNLWGKLGDQMCIQESSTLLLACEDLICTTLPWAEAPSFYQGALLGYLFQKLVRYIAAFRQFPHKSNNFQSFFFAMRIVRLVEAYHWCAANICESEVVPFGIESCTIIMLDTGWTCRQVVK